jgi:hypothetical protein
VRGKTSLTAEELARLEQLCAGMDNARKYIHDVITITFERKLPPDVAALLAAENFPAVQE